MTITIHNTLLRMPSPFALMTLLAVTFGCLSVSAELIGHAKLQRYLSIACQREKMTVKLDFSRKRHAAMSKKLSESIWRGRICIGAERSGECCSQLNMIQGNHVVTVGYSKCDIEKTYFEAGFDFLAKIHYRSITGEHEEFDVKCAVPFMESHVKAKMVVSKKEVNLSTLDAMNLRMKDPEIVKIRLGSNIHIAIEPTIEGMQQRLHTYPLRCWTSTALSRGSHATEDAYRSYFIREGCPIASGDQKLSVIEQNTGTGRYAEWTKLTVPATYYVLPVALLNGSEYSDDAEYGPFYIGCDVVICTGDELAGFQSTPMCPRAAFCETGQPQIPGWLQPFAATPITVESNSKLILVKKNSSEPFDDEDNNTSDTPKLTTDPSKKQTKDCASECSMAVEEGTFTGGHDEECHSNEGIPIYVVVIIAIISFGFGVAFVATLWTIHIRTDPLRKIRCMDRTSSAALSIATASGAHLDPTLRSGNAFMSTALIERQRLVRNQT